MKNEIDKNVGTVRNLYYKEIRFINNSKKYKIKIDKARLYAKALLLLHIV